jgi:hypothetical protein
MNSPFILRGASALFGLCGMSFEDSIKKATTLRPQGVAVVPVRVVAPGP